MTSVQPHSILGSLRSVTPQRTLSFDEALRVAELQACKLAELLDTGDGIRDYHLAGLPRIEVVYEDLAVSGMSHWNGQSWIIAIASRDSLARQRFTLLHEFKHIVDHGGSRWLYAGDATHTPAEQAEAAADYFAGCALISKRQLKSAWGRRIQRVSDLAALFSVSEHAIRVRLAQTGLSVASDRPPTARCARPVATPANQPQHFRIRRPAYGRRTYA
jgi:Zn-dependent peptidase ImmA (M78 family)